MSVPVLIEWFVAVLLIVTGASHVLQPRLWSAMFTDLLKAPYAALIIGLLSVLIGLPIVLGHNIWEWKVSVLVTVIGWAWTGKGVLYLCFPSILPKVAARHVKHPRHFTVSGAVVIALGGVVLVDRLINVA